jgi:hypothetical protein
MTEQKQQQFAVQVTCLSARNLKKGDRDGEAGLVLFLLLIIIFIESYLIVH